MTREEAIKWLGHINTREFGWDDYAMQDSQKEIRERCEQSIREAIDMAISALSAESRPIKVRDDGTLFVKVLDVSKVERIIIGDDSMAIREDFPKPFSNILTESPNDVVEKNDEVINHDREWIIGCIKHDGFIKTDRFDKANQIILEALEPTEPSDLISRAEAIKAINKATNEPNYQHESEDWCSGLFQAEQLIQALPSVSVESKATENNYDCDLITRANAIEALCHNCAYYTDAQCKTDSGYWCESGAMIREDIPSAERKLADDVTVKIDEESYEIGYTDGQKSAERVGEWIKHEIEDTLRWQECSLCHKEYPNMTMNYCPNCGARMENKK